jgi:CubicO group peptidase (beta-lactamase class C family)
MSSAGLSTSRLGRLREVLSGYVERQYAPGVVALVSSGDDVHVEVLGSQSTDGAAPMRRDTIFRIASITKPVVAAAAMMLVEECKIRLDDAIDRWLPELANRRVLTSLSAPIDESVPAERPITLRDLLTSCMGFGSVMAMPDTYPIQRSIREYRIGGDGPMRPTDFPAADEWLRNLGALPLIAQPGERWMYNVSSDVLGILIARVSGQSLGSFMNERLFEPLGMRDTAFHIVPDKIERLSTFYFFDQEKGALDVFDDAEHSAWRDESAFEFGSGGLVSTVDDYFAFARMMLNKGKHGNQRILSRSSVELMTADHLSPQQRAGAEIFFGTHSSWGFGMAVDIAQDEIFHRRGRFGWDGGFGTSAYVDPEAGVIGILLTQRMVDSPEPPTLYADFWTATYAAVE